MKLGNKDQSLDLACESRFAFANVALILSDASATIGTGHPVAWIFRAFSNLLPSSDSRFEFGGDTDRVSADPDVFQTPNESGRGSGLESSGFLFA